VFLLRGLQIHVCLGCASGVGEDRLNSTLIRQLAFLLSEKSLDEVADGLVDDDNTARRSLERNLVQSDALPLLTLTVSNLPSFLKAGKEQYEMEAYGIP
jgi:hypothetical protein